MYERLTLVLDPAEMAALRKAARQDLRKPRDQVRHILRVALLADPPDPPKKNEGCTAVIEAIGTPFGIQS
jgi:hypothetical protein